LRLTARSPDLFAGRIAAPVKHGFLGRPKAWWYRLFYCLGVPQSVEDIPPPARDRPANVPPDIEGRAPPPVLCLCHRGGPAPEEKPGCKSPWLTPQGEQHGPNGSHLNPSVSGSPLAGGFWPTFPVPPPRKKNRARSRAHGLRAGSTLLFPNMGENPFAKGPPGDGLRLFPSRGRPRPWRSWAFCFETIRPNSPRRGPPARKNQPWPNNPISGNSRPFARGALGPNFAQASPLNFAS